MRRTATRAAAALALGAVVVLAAGCDQREVRGDTTIFSFADWLFLLVIGGGVVLIPVGYLVQRGQEKWSQRWMRGWTLATFIPFFLLVGVGPSMYRTQVVLDPIHFESTYGLWFAMHHDDVRFDELSFIQLRGEIKRTSRGGSRTEYKIHCLKKSGGDQVVPVGDLMKQAVPDILERARVRGVPVTVTEPNEG